MLLDAAGRKFAELRPGRNDIGGLAPGVYFVRELAVSSEQSGRGAAAPVRRVVVVR